MAGIEQLDDSISFSGMSDRQSKELLALLGESVAVAHEIVVASKLAPRSKPIKSLTLMILYQMAEKGASVHQLASEGLSAGVETIVRTMFESRVDLQNLLNDPENYPNYLFAGAALSQRKQIDIAINNPEWRWSALSRIEAASTAGCTLEEFRTVKDDEVQYLKSKLPGKFCKGANKKLLETSIEVRAKWAGLKHEYDQMYRYLSAVSHSDMIAVTGRADKHVSTWWPPKRRPCSGASMQVAATYLIQAIDKVTKKLKLRRHKLPALEKRLANCLNPADQ